ncbi:MAG: methylated-DNA--[protein]-cysteine S-methyltransferase [Acidobacteriota bacterium]
MVYDYLETPIGSLLIVGTEHALVRVAFEQDRRPEDPPEEAEHDPVALEAAKSQLAEYFDGERDVFDLDLEPEGTDFQRAVWSALATIPFGETWSYAQLAERIGRPSAVRAVGAANGRNPLPIVLPCHRVIGADGSLTGFGGGLDAKRFLLDLEGAVYRDAERQRELAL